MRARMLFAGKRREGRGVPAAALVCVLAFAGGCEDPDQSLPAPARPGGASASPAVTDTPTDTLGPFAAGTAYPAAPVDMHKLVEEAFRGIPEPARRQDYELIGVILPHGALGAMGRPSAMAWQLLKRPSVERVVMLIPAGTRRPGYVAVTGAERWVGPFGQVTLDRELAHRLAEEHDFIQRDDSLFATSPEAEAHLPLIAWTRPDLKVLPLFIGDETLGLSRRLAGALAQSAPVGPAAPIVALANLPGERGRDVMVDLDPGAVRGQVRDGGLPPGPMGPISTLLDVARTVGAVRPKGLREGPAGASFVVLTRTARTGDLPFTPPPAPAVSGWSAFVERDLLEVAKKTVIGHVLMGHVARLPRHNQGPLSQPSAAFVSIRTGTGAGVTLRARAGSVDGSQPLLEAVRNAAADAVRQILPKLEERDLATLEIEVTVPAQLVPLDRADLSSVEVGREGVVVRREASEPGEADWEGVVLPQDAGSLGWSGPVLLRQACLAASLPLECHKDPRTQWRRFRARAIRNDPALALPPPAQPGKVKAVRNLQPIPGRP